MKADTVSHMTVDTRRKKTTCYTTRKAVAETVHIIKARQESIISFNSKRAVRVAMAIIASLASESLSIQLVNKLAITPPHILFDER